MHKGSVYQSKEWIHAKIASGEKPLVLAGISAFERKRKIPFIGEKTILFAEGSLDSINNEEYISKLKEFKTQSKKYFYGVIAPTVLAPNQDIFKSAGLRKVSNNTILLDLSQSKEDLWNNLEKKSIRWGIKTAEKNALTFQLADKGEVQDFYKLYSRIAENGMFHAENEEFVKILSNTSISKLFLVKNKEKIVAGGLILIDQHNNYSILNLTASSEEGLKLQAMPYLYWNLILYSKSLGLAHFDLGGYDLEAKGTDKTYNINKFKARFGGKVVEQPIYSTNWKYPFFRGILKRFSLLKSIYKKN